MKKRLSDLLAFIKTTDLEEVVWEKKGAVIRVERRFSSASPAEPIVPLVPGEANPTQSTLDATGGAAPSAMVIRSTMVGTFYRADSPTRPPLVVEGTQVTSGQPVAAIEAMKIMKDVVAPQNCRIVKALVANGHAVEYGQPLFEIEPSMATDPAAHV